MKSLFCLNVGHEDAQSRRVTAAMGLVGGIVAMPSIATSRPWLAVVVAIVMIVVGIGYVARGVAGAGTWLFGSLLVILGVVDWLAARGGYGVWAFGIGLVVALAGFGTAVTGRCPINTVLGVDTRPHAGNTKGSGASSPPSAASHRP